MKIIFDLQKKIKRKIIQPLNTLEFLDINLLNIALSSHFILLLFSL